MLTRTQVLLPQPEDLVFGDASVRPWLVVKERHLWVMKWLAFRW